jgi:type II secretory pathway component PulF
MPAFRFQAMDKSGGRVSDTVTAASKDAAIAELYDQGLFVSSINLDKPSGLAGLSLDRGGVGRADVERLATELSILLRSGVRIDRGLSVLERNSKSSGLKQLLGSVITAVRGGDSLSNALSKHESIFGRLFINLVRAGEASGRLDIVFAQLSSDLKYQQQLRNNVIQALTYPAVIFSVCVICVMFVFNYVVPQMSPLFEGVDNIPTYTAALLAASDWLRANQWYAGAGLAAVIAVVVRSLMVPATRAQVLRQFSGFPLIGPMMLQVNQVQVNSTLAMTLSAGIPVDEALGMASMSVENPDVANSLKSAQEQVRRGATLTSSLANSTLYPDFALSLIEVGEESGDLIPCFEELTARARSQFELRVAQFTAVLEPLLILAMGAIVGGVVVTMLLSVVSVNDVAF